MRPDLWRLILHTEPACSGALNMSIDEALAHNAKAEGPALRLYCWNPPALSFGRNQIARDAFDPELAAARGVDIVRRPTGGSAVYHDQELTYSVAVADDLFSPRELYHSINRALVHALRELGADARLAAGSVRRPDVSAGPCFETVAAGEVTVGGRKVIGSAQRRVSGAILQHGSLLLDGSQAVVSELMRTPAPLEGADLPLSRVLGRRPRLEDVVCAVQTGLARTLGIRLAPADLTPSEWQHARAREAHYASDEWTWRR